MLTCHTVSIAIAQATNVSLVYVIDSYRPIAGETVVSQLAFKCKLVVFYPQYPHLTPDSLFRIFAVVLHQSLDRRLWLRQVIRYHGRYQCCSTFGMGSILHLGWPHSGRYTQMEAADQDHRLERG